MPPKTKKTSHDRELLLRWVTSIILAPILIWVIGFADHLWLLFLVILAIAIGHWELNRILFSGWGKEISGWVFAVLALLLPILSYTNGLQGLLIALLINLVGFFIEAIRSYENVNPATEVLLSRVFSVIYVPFLLSHILFLPRVWIFFTLSVIFAGDAGAFFFGRRFGRHKLSPKVSPGKTIEGSLGGLAMSLLVAFLFGLRFHLSRELPLVILIALLLNGVGQLGDLAESLLKREKKIKDSSTILPGHGGLLDRMDSLLLAFPLVYYLI